MYSRSKVLAPGLGAPRPAPEPSGSRPEPSGSRPEPSGSRPEPGAPQGRTRGAEAAPGRPSRELPGRARPGPAGCPGAYTLIAPNENRRSQIQRIAEKELENLEKWKEQNRAKPVNLLPRRLGGSQSEAEVRQKQQLQQMQSKYRQKLKREESIRIKKAAEEAEIQKMKAIQREKSNKLEEKRRLQEDLRREAFREHQQYKTAQFLSRLDTGFPYRSTGQAVPRDPHSSTWKLPALPGDDGWARSRAYEHSPGEEEDRRLQELKEEQHQKSELLAWKRQLQEEERARTHQTEHRRVNNAFLDRLQGRSQPGGPEQSGGYWNMNSSNSWGI
ncbi:epithelial-stromal interaction protein 1 [Dasypus novemcinctus]|uniref:epithelial-stromal interaction protein 1 n=1 Tax=Dasypus novemcinctus TaxID=9361 RepID=UPI00265DF42B|nr:epithelial-stromal interaction protein 1 [Dasypus novemcinctus]